MKELLTGIPGVGKSTVLREVLKGYKGQIRGVITEEIRDSEGKRVGFEVVNFKKDQKLLAHKTSVVSDSSIGDYKVDIGVIEQFVVPELEKGITGFGGLVIVDEIGRMQALSKTFLMTLENLFDSDAHILATIVYDPEPWSLQYKHRSDVTVIEVTEQNRNLLPEQILLKLKTLS